MATDLLWEATLYLAFRRPLQLLRCLGSIPGGRAVFKRELALRSHPDPASLPYRQEVLDFLREQRAAGRAIVLATASDQRWAKAVAQHVGLFDDVVASDGSSNLKGEAKLEVILSRYGNGFDYVGDSSADLPLWRAAEESYLIAPSRHLLAAASRVRHAHILGRESRSRLLPILKVLRPHQWAKNSLLLVPLITSHQVAAPAKLITLLIAVIAFSLCSSAIYVFNDLVDIEADRRHPAKRRRAFASGQLPVRYGPPLLIALLAASLSITIVYLPVGFLLLLLLYFVGCNCYSFYFKRKLLLDVIILAELYTLRVYAGAVVTNIQVSPWLAAFSMFVFLSLAFVKRYTELRAVDALSRKPGGTRGYRPDDLPLIEGMGLASGCLSVLVLALYINSETVTKLYHNPGHLLLICPLLMYWIGRLWFIARRHHLTADPVTFALRDRTSWMVIAAVAMVYLWAWWY